MTLGFGDYVLEQKNHELHPIGYLHTNFIQLHSVFRLP